MKQITVEELALSIDYALCDSIHDNLCVVISKYYDCLKHGFHPISKFRNLLNIKQHHQDSFYLTWEASIYVLDIKHEFQYFLTQTSQIMSKEDIEYYNKSTNNLNDYLKSILKTLNDNLNQIPKKLSIEYNNEDIIISDPCYLNNKWYRDVYLDLLSLDNVYQEDLLFSNNIPKFEYPHIHSETLYGDWDCTVTDIDNKKEIGSFCADSGLVIVCSLNDVKTINPNIETWFKQNSHNTTIIRNFTGTVSIVWNPQQIIEDNKTVFYRECQVVGIGNINFISQQI